MLTVACVWVQGNVPYSVDYVLRVRAMVSRHLPQPHRFVCLTDQPQALPSDIWYERIARPARGVFGWWSKLELFRPGRFDGRVLYLDLDSLVVNSLEPVADFRSPFALIPDAGTFKPKTGHCVIKRFNSSVMVWDAGVCDDLFTEWTPAVTATLWGDQDWIGLRRPDADMMPMSWFPRLSGVQNGPVPPDARVVLAKKPKPSAAAEMWPWVRDVWGAV